MRTAALLVGFMVLGCATGAAAQTAPAPSGACALTAAAGVAQLSLVSAGRERAYRLFVPPGYDGRTSLPLVLDLHGSGGNSGGQAANSRFEALAANEGFLVAT